MTFKSKLRSRLKLASRMPHCGVARCLSNTRYAPRFSGVYARREDAVAAAGRAAGYDNDATAEVSFDVMCERTAWDYPVLFWLSQLLPHAPAVLDAGGHMGTKYIAFEGLLDLSDVHWTVYDLPAIVRAARIRQANKTIPAEIRFVDTLSDAPKVDILLASGLLQYLDVAFSSFIGNLPKPPQFIVLNKVALCHEPTRFTLERIGSARVPYQIRNRAAFEREIAVLGYRVLDRWTIPDLGHIIPTHPWIGSSESCGFMLERT